MSPARDRSPQRGSSLGRFLNQGQWAILLFLYAAIIFAGLFSVEPYRDTSPSHTLGAWLAVWFRIYAFHIGLVCGVVAALALVTLRLGRMFCTLPLMWFCLSEELGDYRDKTVPAVAGETVTVMTYCLYPLGPPDAAAVLSEVQQANPDVLLLQRFTNEWSGALHETLVQTYHYYLPIVRDDYLGTAIYSRRAFDFGDEERSGLVSLANKQVRQARAVIQIDGKPVAIYCLRLLPQLRLQEATTSRVQFADLLEYLEKEKLPAIVAGDFSFTRRTPQGKSLREGEYVDAYQLVGKGRGGTWPANHKSTWLPLVQLDHIYLSPALTCTECRTGQPAGSDHLPVIARIGFSTTESGKTAADRPTDLPKTDLPAAAGSKTGAATGTTVPSATAPGNALFGRASSSTTSSSAVSSSVASSGATLPSSASKAASTRAQAALLESLRPIRERPPRRDPVAAADGGPPPRREPWSGGDEPPDRSPDPPPLRAPVGSQ